MQFLTVLSDAHWPCARRNKPKFFNFPFNQRILHVKYTYYYTGILILANSNNNHHDCHNHTSPCMHTVKKIHLITLPLTTPLIQYRSTCTTINPTLSTQIT